METPSEPRFPSASSPGPSRKEKLTAEERLFQVIENGGVPLDQPAGGRAARFNAYFKRALGWLKKISPLQVLEQTRGTLAHPHFHLAFVNRILIVLTGIGLLATLTNTFFFKPDINRVYNRVVQMNMPTDNAPAAALRRPVEDYLTAITRRNLFQPGGKVETKPNTTAAVPFPSAGVDEVLNNLQLVGIAWGVYPEAMIRDKKESRTHFIKQGQKFKDILVKEILKDRVIVEYGGHPKELM